MCSSQSVVEPNRRRDGQSRPWLARRTRSRRLAICHAAGSYKTRAPAARPTTAVASVLALKTTMTSSGRAKPAGHRLYPQYRSVKVLNGNFGGLSGLWPVRMMEAFGWPLRDFSFDDSRVRPTPTSGVEPTDEGENRVSPDGRCPIRVRRGKKRPEPQNGGRYVTQQRTTPCRGHVAHAARPRP